MQEIDLQTLREQLCEIGALMYSRGYVVSNDGNLSVRYGDDALLITPAGVGKGRMTPEMMVPCGLDGLPRHGGRQPSSEVKMHLEVYRHRPDVAAVIHAHPPVSTAFAVCRRPIERCYLPELLVGIGPVPLADYALPSTEEVPASVRPHLGGQAVLLANHGLLAWAGGLPKAVWKLPNAAALIAADLWAAFDKLEVVEYAAGMELRVAQLGGGVELTAGEVERLLQLRGYYKQLAEVKLTGTIPSASKEEATNGSIPKTDGPQ